MRNRQGCLAGLLELFLLNKLFDWLQRRFGFGRGCSGAGCGLILLIFAILLTCAVLTRTNWLHLF
jgi:hypothetical protein